MSTPIARGLIFTFDAIYSILHEQKTWEMRSRATPHRGPIALIVKGSGTIVGVADLVDCKGPLSPQEIIANQAMCSISSERQRSPESAGHHYAWVLADVQTLPLPVSYLHKKGVATWVALDAAAVEGVARQLKR